MPFFYLSIPAAPRTSLIRNLLPGMIHVILSGMYELRDRHKAVALLLEAGYDAVERIRRVLGSVVHENYRPAVKVLVLSDRPLLLCAQNAKFFRIKYKNHF